MTEKNAVKSETVSPAREWLDIYVDSPQGCEWLEKSRYGGGEDVLVKMLTAYASHVSSLSSQAPPVNETVNAKEFLDGFEKAFRRNRRRPMQWADIEELMTTYAAHYVRAAMFKGYSFEELTRIINEHKSGSLSSQAIGAAAKEAAETMYDDEYGKNVSDPDHKQRWSTRRAAIILRAIEKARTK